MINILLILPSFAALPPVHQNTKDLNVMVDFVQNHPQIMQQLRSINLEKKQIFFNKNCIVYFQRATQIRPPNWVGPAPDLIYHKSNCDIN